MPEIPDVENYREALEERLLGQAIDAIRLHSPFVLRTVEPPLDSLHGKRVTAVTRIGKRIGLIAESELALIIHLMIAGRLHWRDDPPRRGQKKAPAGKSLLLSITTSGGSLYLTEAGSRRRASVHVVQGVAARQSIDPGGLEAQHIDFETFRERAQRSNHTLKRILTDPRIFAGIGNAYSDEILHRARLGPMTQSARLDEATLRRLYVAIRETLNEWTERLRDERKAGSGFPEKVTAFHPGMAVHGKYGEPCPVCGSPVQRIVYSSNETNYCATCQTGGQLLKDRALSRLLKDSWPTRLPE